MNLHALIKTGLILASDEGADIVVLMEDESGELVAYIGNEGNYEEHDRAELPEEADDLEAILGTAEEFLDELVNVTGEVIEGTAETL